MATNQKIETLLRAALEATPGEREKSADLAIGVSPTGDQWEVIIRYFGELSLLQEKYPTLQINELLNNYAILRIPESLIDAVASEDMVTYMEKPKQLFYEVNEGKRASCIPALQSTPPQNNIPFLTGKGICIALIDSGIDYSHPDFRNPDGTTRILTLWDQTLGTADSPGAVFPADTINAALRAGTLQEQEAICPSRDLSGHGTHVAGIAAGNGRASNGINRGVAYEADLLVVKLGTPGPNSFPSTSLLMEAVDFCIRESLKRNLPMVINLSFGNTYGSHSGSSLTETYLDAVSTLGRISIVVGSGNEGVSAGHTGGILTGRQPEIIEFSVSDYATGLSIQLWKNYWDSFSITIIPPVGRSITLPDTLGATRFSFGGTALYSYNGAPTPYNPFQEIYLDFLPENAYLTPGLWRIRLTPQRIRNGLWDMWMPANALRNELTRFLRPTPDTTLTIPSTAARVITVGAYDAQQNSPAPFSGRGFTWNNQYPKPDLVAPGVDITSCAPGGGYAVRSGTSMATPFVSGSAALLMEWGIQKDNDPFLYGEKMRAYLIDGAKPLPGFDNFPNPQIGWGALCLYNSLYTFLVER